eukprot:s434_g9.t1
MQFGLRIFDDQGNATKVKELYRAMIQDRLVDLFLGPQTQALSEAARAVTTALNRTLMLWSLHTMSVDNFPLQAGHPGTFSVAVPVENMMDQGLRMLKSLGSTEVRAIVGTAENGGEIVAWVTSSSHECGTDRISEFMCTKAIERAEALGYAPQSHVARPLNNYQLLTQMQLRFTRPLDRGGSAVCAGGWWERWDDVLLTCTSEAEMLNVVMVASRLNVSAQAMLSYNADSLATYNTVGPAVTALLAPSDWHHEVSYPCRAFIDTQTYVQIFQFRYNQLPSAGAAVATAAAITLMATLKQTVFEVGDYEDVHNGSALVLYRADLDLCVQFMPGTLNLSLQSCSNPAGWQLVRNHLQNQDTGLCATLEPPTPFEACSPPPSTLWLPAQENKSQCGKVTMRECVFTNATARSDEDDMVSYGFQEWQLDSIGRLTLQSLPNVSFGLCLFVSGEGDAAVVKRCNDLHLFGRPEYASRAEVVAVVCSNASHEFCKHGHHKGSCMCVCKVPYTGFTCANVDENLAGNLSCRERQEVGPAAEYRPEAVLARMQVCLNLIFSLDLMAWPWIWAAVMATSFFLKAVGGCIVCCLCLRGGNSRGGGLGLKMWVDQRLLEIWICCIGPCIICLMGLCIVWPVGNLVYDWALFIYFSKFRRGEWPHADRAILFCSGEIAFSSYLFVPQVLCGLLTLQEAWSCLWHEPEFQSPKTMLGIPLGVSKAHWMIVGEALTLQPLVGLVLSVSGSSLLECALGISLLLLQIAEMCALYYARENDKTILRVESVFTLLQDLPQFLFTTFIQVAGETDEFVIYATVNAATSLLVQLARASHARRFEYESLLPSVDGPEGPDLEKNIRLAAQLQSTVVNTIVGPVRFKSDGSSDRWVMQIMCMAFQLVGTAETELNQYTQEEYLKIGLQLDRRGQQTLYLLWKLDPDLCRQSCNDIEAGRIYNWGTFLHWKYVDRSALAPTIEFESESERLATIWSDVESESERLAAVESDVESERLATVESDLLVNLNLSAWQQLSLMLSVNLNHLLILIQNLNLILLRSAVMDAVCRNCRQHVWSWPDFDQKCNDILAKYKQLDPDSTEWKLGLTQQLSDIVRVNNSDICACLA